jgi:hypothetical protein
MGSDIGKMSVDPLSLINAAGDGTAKVGEYVRVIGTNAKAATSDTAKLFGQMAEGAKKAAKEIYIASENMAGLLIGSKFIPRMMENQSAERYNYNFFGPTESPGIPSKAGIKSQREAIQISALYTEQSNRSTEAMYQAREAAVQLSQAYANIIEAGFENSLFLMAEGIGKVAAGTGTMNDMFANLLNGLADILMQFGKLAISAGITSEAIRKAFTLTGIPAIVAGAALIALAQGVRAKAASLAPPALAEGGLAYGRTLATVGEYQGARSNPEVIAPLNKLRGMMGGGSMDIYVHSRLRGSDLLTVNERAKTKYARL